MSKTLKLYQRKVECCNLAREIAPLDEEKPVINPKYVKSSGRRDPKITL